MNSQVAADTHAAAPRASRGIACLCAGVSYADLDDAIARDMAASIESLGATLGCGIQCGSCIPAIKEALGEVAWFAATVCPTPITRANCIAGLDRLIFRLEIVLCEDGHYPRVLPGQHVVLRATTEHGIVERTYTVVAQDLPARTLAIAVRRTPGGKMTPWLLSPLLGGTHRRIEVSVPGGPGLIAEPGRATVFFAGGVGITPAVSMANALAPSSTMHLDYSVTHAKDAAFLPEFEARCRERPLLTIRVRQSLLEGPLSEGDIDELVVSYPEAKFYICGPAGYVDLVHRALRRAGVEPSRIHVELFSLGVPATPARSFRSRAYAAGALLAALPLLLLLPGLEGVRAHGHPNVGHEKLACISCHVDSTASTRQTFQAKVKHALGLRQTGAVMGMQPVTSATCIQCHANPDDRHAPNRFLELRFEEARAEIAPQLCVSCHREHSAARVTAPSAGYCVSCHQEMKVKDDKASPTHQQLVLNKRWNTCLQCHDYHGNHKWNPPLRLQDATTLEVLNKYLVDGASPYGETLVKAKRELPP